MDTRDLQDQLRCALNTSEGQQLIADALLKCWNDGSNAVECHTLRLGANGNQVLTCSEVNLSVQAIVDRTEADPTDQRLRKTRYDFTELVPFDRTAYYNASLRQHTWEIRAGDYAYIGVGLGFVAPELRGRFFKPSIDLECRVRVELVDSPSDGAETVVMIVNETNSPIKLHKNQRLGTLQFPIVVNTPISFT